MEKLVRLSKLMSERGICSRREADDYIAKGLVLVEGQVIQELGTKVAPDVKITLKTAAKDTQSQKLTILLNKPVGYVSNLPEKGYREALELITSQNRDPKDTSPFKLPKKLIKFAVSGRLDINSKGLLVLTQDGRIAKQLIGQNTDIEKEYLVRVSGDITDSKLKKLRFGLSLDGKALKRAQVKQIENGLLQFILKEGKKRQIRRMCELVELTVTSIKRVRIGKVKLGTLKLGHWRFLRSNEHF